MCKNCGKELYESQFAQVAKELEEDTNNVSELEIQSIENEQKNY